MTRTQKRGDEVQERLELLEFARAIGAVATFGGFVDGALAHLTRTFDTTLATFNRLDMRTESATVISRPFRTEHVDAFDSVSEQSREHPLLSWVTQQTHWPVVRLSDVATKEQLAASSLYRDVLCHIGAAFSLFIFLSSPQSSQWIYLVANRADRDFGDPELQVARGLQPVLTAVLSRWSAPTPPPDVARAITRRELDVLSHLATGLTAEAIAHAVGTRPATVRKQLQNIYAKLAVSNRLDAVIQARQIGLLNEEDLSSEWAQKIRTHMPKVTERGTHHG